MAKKRKKKVISNNCNDSLKYEGRTVEHVVIPMATSESLATGKFAKMMRLQCGPDPLKFKSE